MLLFSQIPIPNRRITNVSRFSLGWNVILKDFSFRSRRGLSVWERPRCIISIIRMVLRRWIRDFEEALTKVCQKCANSTFFSSRRRMQMCFKYAWYKMFFEMKANYKSWIKYSRKINFFFVKIAANFVKIVEKSIKITWNEVKRIWRKIE